MYELWIMNYELWEHRENHSAFYCDISTLRSNSVNPIPPAVPKGKVPNGAFKEKVFFVNFSDVSNLAPLIMKPTFLSNLSPGAPPQVPTRPQAYA